MNPLPASPATDPLAGLRPYQLPDAVAWWPPAPGWWLLLLVLGLLGLALGWSAVRRRRRDATWRQALRELAALRAELVTRQDRAALVRGVSRLLRRAALTAYPGQPVAALTGETWLQFLDAHGGDGRFRHGPGRVLADGPYRPAAEFAPVELLDLAQDWLQRCRVGRR